MSEPTKQDDERARCWLEKHTTEQPWNLLAAEFAAVREEGRREERARIERIVCEITGAKDKLSGVYSAVGRDILRRVREEDQRGDEWRDMLEAADNALVLDEHREWYGHNSDSSTCGKCGLSWPCPTALRRIREELER